jgi:hypothetical protein
MLAPFSSGMHFALRKDCELPSDIVATRRPNQTVVAKPYTRMPLWLAMQGVMLGLFRSLLDRLELPPIAPSLPNQSAVY